MEGWRKIKKNGLFLWNGLTVGIILLVASCTVPVLQPRLLDTVAVLPFDSESNNLDAPEVLQKHVYWALRPSAYRVVDMKEVNALMEKVGISDGGQLAAIDPVKLGKDLGVQALLYGNVVAFQYLNVGFYRHKKVKLDLRLVDATTGQTIWEGNGSGYTPNIALNSNDAIKGLASGLEEQSVDSNTKMPLEHESRLAVMDALSKLPGFQFHGFDIDDPNFKSKSLLNSVLKKELIKNK